MADTPFPKGDPSLMYDLARERLSAQLAAVDSVDGKFATLITLASAMLGIAAAVFALHAAWTASSTDAVSLTGLDITTLVVGGGIYLVVAITGIVGYLARNWDSGPTLNAVFEQECRDDHPDAIKWGVAIDCWHAFDTNEKPLRLKHCLLSVVLIGAALETAVLVTSLVLVAEKV